MRTWMGVIVVFALSWQLVAAAQDLYVTDRVAVPLYAKPDARSKVVSLTFSGLPVTRLAREGEFIKVKTLAGASGWLKASRLISKPDNDSQSLRADQKRIAVKLEQVQKQLASSIDQQLQMQKPKARSKPNSPSILLLGLSALLLLAIGFISGVAWWDWLQRKRHGGFRV